MIIIVKKFCLNLNQKIRHKTDVSGTKDVEMINRLNYLSNFWIFTVANQATLFAITDTKFNVLVLTFSC